MKDATLDMRMDRTATLDAAATPSVLRKSRREIIF